MQYEESYKRLEDILRRAKDNQGTVIISTDDMTAIEEAEIAICRTSGLVIKKRGKIIFPLFLFFLQFNYDIIILLRFQTLTLNC